MSERWDLRLGRWQDVLADVECDALICDPPYSARTHEGFNTLKPETFSDSGSATRTLTQVSYLHWTPEDVAAFVAHWSPRTAGWMVALTSHDLAPAWEAAYTAANRLAFAPLPCTTIGGSIRFAGDGPSSWTVWAMVARPRSARFAKWGTLPGAYVIERTSAWQFGGGGGRGKSLDLMRAIVRDYSRPGDLICDPTAGLATTGVAALTMGRRFVGSECDPETFEKGRKRLSETQVVDLFDAGRATQEVLL